MFKQYMVVKTITVTEEAYNSFSRLKQPGESFSELMKRISNKTSTVDDILGALHGKINFKNLRKKTKEVRERINNSMEERHERLRQFRANRAS